MLLQNHHHLRDRSTSLDRMQDELNALLNGKASEFLQAIRADKTRYTRDQFRLIRTLYDRYGLAATLEAIDFCSGSRLFSVNYMKDYLEHSATPGNHAGDSDYPDKRQKISCHHRKAPP